MRCETAVGALMGCAFSASLVSSKINENPNMAFLILLGTITGGLIGRVLKTLCCNEQESEDYEAVGVDEVLDIPARTESKSESKLEFSRSFSMA